MRKRYIGGSTPSRIFRQVGGGEFIGIIHIRCGTDKADSALRAFKITGVIYVFQPFAGIEYRCQIGRLHRRLNGGVPIAGRPTLRICRMRSMRRPPFVLRIQLLLRVVGNTGKSVLVNPVFSGINNGGSLNAGKRYRELAFAGAGHNDVFVCRRYCIGVIDSYNIRIKFERP